MSKLAPYEKICKLRRLFPIPSDTDIIITNDNIKQIIDKSVGITNMMSNHHRYCPEITFCYMGVYSLYDFAIKMSYDKSEEKCLRGKSPNVIFYASLNGDGCDVPRFIEESAEMVNGEHKVDPLERGDHRTEIFIRTDNIYPLTPGIEELFEKAKKNRNIWLHLVVKEVFVDRKIREKNEQV